MSKSRMAAAASLIVGICSLAGPAQAQTRTWVSGVGDDINPCSRTAPCKTFPRAMSVTVSGGEIDTLDPAGYGAVTITKSITIDAYSGLGGVLAAGVNGIVINALSTDVVILRNLDINGAGSGLNGISIIAAGDVRIENCKIWGFTQRGIVDQRTAGDLFVKDTVVSNNAQTGILTLTGGSSTLNVTLNGVQMHSNGNAGFAITAGTRASVVDSSANSNVHGFYADSGAQLNLDHSTAFGNVSTGINSQSAATIRMFSSTVTNNGTGLSASAGGSILSYGLNRIAGNAAGNGPPTGTIGVQ